MLWGYLLSEDFGGQFSEAVTAAHEVGSHNTPDESQRDRHNNALGREYHSKGVPLDDLLGKIATDMRVAIRGR